MILEELLEEEGEATATRRKDCLLSCKRPMEALATLKKLQKIEVKYTPEQEIIAENWR